MLKNFDCTCVQGSDNLEPDNITFNSGKVTGGSVFVCIKGTAVDGHDFVEEAISRGASAIVCSQDIEVPKDITVIKTDDTRKALAEMASAYFGNPSQDLSVIGVTGTKGKTTTAYMIKEILEKAGVKTGLIGTVETDTGLRRLESSHTTPESYDVQQYLREMADSGCKAAVIEVSSQALMMGRVHRIVFDCGIFTNIEEDHIGALEHKDFDDYLYWKSTLFTQCRRAVVNGDDPYMNRILAGSTCPVLTYGLGEKNDFYGYDAAPIKLPQKLGMAFKVKGSYNIDLVTGIPGVFTCYNAMAAIAACSFFGAKPEHIKEALERISVPGRGEMFPMPEGRIIMVDYAHNGTALRCLLKSLREYKPSRLTCLFGCGGERDVGRRQRMGCAAAEWADNIVITSDNPRNESPLSIINDIIEPIEKLNGSYTVVEDRREAIQYVVSHCIEDEIAVVCGKGHETYQIIGNRKIHFDDREEVRAAIEKAEYEQNYYRGNS